MNDIISDIAMDGGNFINDGTGDIVITDDRASILQDLQNEMTSFEGDIFDDDSGTYGYGLQDFINLEGTEVNQLELQQRIRTKLRENEYIDQTTVEVEIVKWENESIEISAGLQLFGEDSRLLIYIDKGIISIEEVA